VISSATDLRRELHNLDVGSQAGEDVGDLFDVRGAVEERNMPGESTVAELELPGRDGDLDAGDERHLGEGETFELIWDGDAEAKAGGRGESGLLRHIIRSSVPR
jgi:hypothetical protein